MLEITVPQKTLWDEFNEVFITVKDTTLRLEHSLVSISKWESKWHKPFLTKDPLTYEQTIDYVRCMTLTQNVDPNVYYGLTQENISMINDYIEADLTATWFNDKRPNTPMREQPTSELIYYWMITLGIPFECQKWHLSRLITLIRVCNIKNSTDKMSQREILSQNRALNEARRKAMHTKG